LIRSAPSYLHALLTAAAAAITPQQQKRGKIAIYRCMPNMKINFWSLAAIVVATPHVRSNVATWHPSSCCEKHARLCLVSLSANRQVNI
jgi:hypothetical protein